ncbi:MAG: hypothetical protein Q7J55_00755, partial [bacterium]|nr:hypothetical protein [bacterium]
CGRIASFGEQFGPERFSSEQFSLELTAERFTALLTAEGLSRAIRPYGVVHHKDTKRVDLRLKIEDLPNRLIA